METQKLNDSKFHNHLKAELALLYTKQGIQQFVKEEIEQFQQKCLTDSKGQSLGTCSSCLTQNVIECPTKRICEQKKGKCNFHKNMATKHKKCQKGICDKIYTEIKSAHRYNGPSFRNTDAKQWCTVPWEMAKCFMPLDGYTDVHCVEETDLNGILNVILNYAHIQSKIQCDLSQDQQNVFQEARVIARKVRHSANLEIEDADLHQYLLTLKALLSDALYLLSDTDAKTAREKIIQLEQNDLFVKTTDLLTILNAIQQRMQNENDELKKEMKENLIKDTMSAIKGQEELSISALKDVLSEGLNQIKSSLDEIGDLFNKGKKSMEFTIKEKKKFKADLVMFNERQHNSVPLSPLFDERDTPLEDFYVTPDLATRIKKNEVTLEDVFNKGKKRCNEIYIKAEAGFGKTAFCKRLVMAWCHAQTPRTEEQSYFSREDLNTMTNFDFLFLVSLRDAGNECNIDKMIFEQILQNMAKPSTYTLHFLEETLSNENCLVILDGLDEWMHKPNECTKKEKQVPHRNFRKNTTIATTTRPWKLSVLDLKTSDIENTVEIKGLNNESVRQFTFNAITKMNEYDDRVEDPLDVKAQVKEFNAAIQNSAINTLQEIPLILLYMICLWKDGIELGRSISEFYVGVIEFLLSRCNRNEPLTKNLESTPSANTPICFKEHRFCKIHYQMLIAVGELAFHTLFSKSRENTLVFDRKIAEKYLKDKSLEISLKSGILTQSKEQKFLSFHRKISFAHKSIHEFFAALFIYNEPENALKFAQQVCKNIDDILEMRLVYSFLSGMSLRFSKDLFQMIMKVVAKDQRTQEYVRYSLIWDQGITQALEGIQHMFVNTLNESNDSDREAEVLCLQHFFISCECKIDKYKTALQKLLSVNRNNIKTISIKSSEVISDFNDILETFKLNEIKGLEKVFYRNDSIGEEVKILLEGSIDTLKYLTLTCHKWGEAIRCQWPPALAEQLGLLKKLEGIAIDGFVFEHKSLEHLLNFLKKEASLLEVSLYNIKCVEHSDGCCTLDLTANECIKVLRLNCIPISDIEINVASLKTCDVGKLGVVKKYLQQLESAKNLTTFLCSFLESEDDIKCMIETLSALRHIKCIQLRRMDVGVNQLQLPSEIEKITLWDVEISIEFLKKLKMDMEKHKKSIRVEIKECKTLQDQKTFEEFKEGILRSASFNVESLDDKSGANPFVFASKKKQTTELTK